MAGPRRVVYDLSSDLVLCNRGRGRRERLPATRRRSPLYRRSGDRPRNRWYCLRMVRVEYDGEIRTVEDERLVEVVEEIRRRYRGGIIRVWTPRLTVQADS